MMCAGVDPSQLNDALWDDPLVPGGGSVEEILRALDSPAEQEVRANDSKNNLQSRLSGAFLEQEVQLSGLTLLQLYEMVSGSISCSEYQLYRAKNILDNVLNRRNRR